VKIGFLDFGWARVLIIKPHFWAKKQNQTEAKKTNKKNSAKPFKT